MAVVLAGGSSSMCVEHVSTSLRRSVTNATLHSYKVRRARFDAMSSRTAHERPRRAPVLRARGRVEAGVAQRAERCVVVAEDDRHVAFGRNAGLLGVQQVDLR